MFDTLLKADKEGIFNRLRQLLVADDPYSVPGVADKLIEKRFHAIRRFRAGNYRVLYAVDPTEVVHNKHSYKGTLYIIAIHDRKNAYR